MGYELKQADSRISRPFDLLALVVRDNLSRNDDFFFIQIGAHDGIYSNELHPLIMKYHLRGILVEPIPEYFDRLKKNYTSEPQLIFENYALTHEDGPVRMFYFQPDAPVPKWCLGIASLNRKHLTKFKDSKPHENFIREREVDEISFSSLLIKHNVKKISLLQIDAEGLDLEIPKMLFKTNCRPEIIRYENQHMKHVAKLSADDLLSRNGYRFIDYGINTIAVNNIS